MMSAPALSETELLARQVAKAIFPSQPWELHSEQNQSLFLRAAEKALAGGAHGPSGMAFGRI